MLHLTTSRQTDQSPLNLLVRRCISYFYCIVRYSFSRLFYRPRGPRRALRGASPSACGGPSGPRARVLLALLVVVLYCVTFAKNTPLLR